jgi:hypothetical protein
MKNCQAEFFHVDRQTVLTKRIVALCNFASALKIVVMEGIQLRFHKLAIKKGIHTVQHNFFFYKTINFVFMKVLHVST